MTKNKTLLSADCRTVSFWDVKNGDLIRNIEVEPFGTRLQINSLLCSGEKIIIACDAYTSSHTSYIKIFNENGNHLHTINNTSREIKLCLLPNHKMAGVSEGLICIWDLNNYQIMSEIKDNDISINSEVFALKHGFIAITTPDHYFSSDKIHPRKLFIFDCASGKKVNELPIKNEQVAFSCMPDGNIVIVDKHARVHTINFHPVLKPEAQHSSEYVREIQSNVSLR